MVKQMKTSAIERIVAYHPWKSKGIPRGGMEGKRRTPLLDWISCQLCYQRPIQTKQLFLYGPTNTQIFSFTFFPRQLGFASSGQTYFTGAHDHSDLWLFDDFDQTEAESGALAPTELSSSAKSILKILSGSVDFSPRMLGSSTKKGTYLSYSSPTNYHYHAQSIYRKD